MKHHHIDRDCGHLHAREVQRLHRLFDQQMWAFGRDTTCPEGNLLLRRGFVRTPPPPGAASSGTYRLVEGDLELELSSLGVRATRGAHSVFLDRAPMASLLRGADPLALVRLMRWLASYEAWVEQVAGPAWRSASLLQRSRPPVLPASEMANSWNRTAECLDC